MRSDAAARRSPAPVPPARSDAAPAAAPSRSPGRRQSGERTRAEPRGCSLLRRRQPLGFPPGCWSRPYLAAALGRQVPQQDLAPVAQLPPGDRQPPRHLLGAQRRRPSPARRWRRRLGGQPRSALGCRRHLAEPPGRAGGARRWAEGERRAATSSRAPPSRPRPAPGGGREEAEPPPEPRRRSAAEMARMRSGAARPAGPAARLCGRKAERLRSSRQERPEQTAEHPEEKSSGRELPSRLKSLPRGPRHMAARCQQRGGAAQGALLLQSPPPYHRGALLRLCSPKYRHRSPKFISWESYSQ